MAFYKFNADFLLEKRSFIGEIFNSLGRTDHSFRVLRRGRRIARFTKPSFFIWVLLLFAIFLISFAAFGLKLQLPGEPPTTYSLNYPFFFFHKYLLGYFFHYYYGYSVGNIEILERSSSSSHKFDTSGDGERSVKFSNEVQQEFSGSYDVEKTLRSKRRKQRKRSWLLYH